MLSEVIHSQLSYPAMPLARQLVDQRSVHFGPLVLEVDLLKNRRLQQIGDQPVLRSFFHLLLDGMDYTFTYTDVVQVADW